MINFIFIFGFVSLYALGISIIAGFCYWLVNKFGFPLEEKQ